MPIGRCCKFDRLWLLLISFLTLWAGLLSRRSRLVSVTLFTTFCWLYCFFIFCFSIFIFTLVVYRLIDFFINHPKVYHYTKLLNSNQSFKQIIFFTQSQQFPFRSSQTQKRCQSSTSIVEFQDLKQTLPKSRHIGIFRSHRKISLLLLFGHRSLRVFLSQSICPTIFSICKVIFSCNRHNWSWLRKCWC